MPNERLHAEIHTEEAHRVVAECDGFPPTAPIAAAVLLFLVEGSDAPPDPIDGKW